MDAIKENLIAEINKKHHIKLSSDDPIFAVLTMNSLVSEDMIKKMELLLEMQSSNIAEQNQKLLLDAKQFAQNTITAKVGSIVAELDEKYKTPIKKDVEIPNNSPKNNTYPDFLKDNIIVVSGICLAILLLGILIGVLIR